MGKKAPQDWYKVMFPQQAKEALVSKYEHTGSIGMSDLKGILGDAFEVIGEEKKPKKKKKGKDNE